MFVLNITKKKSRALLFSVVPFRDIPLNQLQSLCDRNPRGITFGYATRDHCFVIASEGVIKKWNRKVPFFVEYCLCPLRGHPIDQPFVAFGNRTPRGTIFVSATRD